LKLDNILDVFGKNREDLKKLGNDNSYHSVVTKKTITELEEAVEDGRRFENWNQMFDFFLLTGHTLRSKFSEDPSGFFKKERKRWWI
jgi:hypothetical protein